jgi:hypothetical protein
MCVLNAGNWLSAGPGGYGLRKIANALYCCRRAIRMQGTDQRIKSRSNELLDYGKPGRCVDERFRQTGLSILSLSGKRIKIHPVPDTVINNAKRLFLCAAVRKLPKIPFVFFS